VKAFYARSTIGVLLAILLASSGAPARAADLHARALAPAIKVTIAQVTLEHQVNGR
jgi:hypothetical protein